MGRILVVLHTFSRFLKTPKTSFLDQQAKDVDDFRFHANSSTRECILRCSRDSIRKNVKKIIFVVVLTPKQSVLQNSPPSPTLRWKKNGKKINHIKDTKNICFA